ncbi:MAG TPA: permease prefix domain 1-containing protein [Desulfobacteria bacterium]|nr:permease prefix domain 1-containing protein [Desulfobacteria bacterium]
MKDKVKKYVDDLFSDIYDTKQLGELKEEVSANLIEKVNDFISSGESKEDAFNKAVSGLGDMSELVENLRKASETKFTEDMFKSPPLDKTHVIGYVLASAILLFGLMTTGIVYFQMNNLMITASTLMPFLIVSVVMFVFLRLTQETAHDYGMNRKRALAYSFAIGLLLFGVFSTAIVYFNGNELFQVPATLMPFLIPSAVILIYLGLTEKSRTKMDAAWQQQWVNYYSNPQQLMVRGNVSGALWIFSLAAFILIGLTLGWRYSWIVFIVAAGCEVLIEAYFAAKRRN